MKYSNSIKNILKINISLFLLLILLLSIAASVVLVMNSADLGEQVIKSTQLKNSKIMSGGDIITIIKRKNYSINIHETVFNNNLLKTNKNFVQIDFVSNKPLPLNIQEEIDYNNDTIADFLISLNTKDNIAYLQKYNNKIIGIMDKASIVDFTPSKAYNFKNTIFAFNNFKRAEFFGYTPAELDSFEKIKKIIIDDEIITFNDTIKQINKGNIIGTKIFHFVSKFHKKVEKVILNYRREKIKGKTKHKLLFKPVDKNKDQQLTIYTSVKSIYKDYKAYPIATYKTCKTVRVLISK